MHNVTTLTSVCIYTWLYRCFSVDHHVCPFHISFLWPCERFVPQSLILCTRSQCCTERSRYVCTFGFFCVCVCVCVITINLISQISYIISSDHRVTFDPDSNLLVVIGKQFLLTSP